MTGQQVQFTIRVAYQGDEGEDVGAAAATLAREVESYDGVILAYVEENSFSPSDLDVSGDDYDGGVAD